MKFRILALALLLPLAVPAVPNTPEQIPLAESRLRLFHTHTGEHLDLVFRRGGTYVDGALDKLNYFLRDHRTGDVPRYNPRVFDLLADLTASVNRTNGELQIICGYRTPRSNEFLRKTTTGVAKNSLHMLAEAIDIRLPGVPLKKFRDAALALQRGGVGFYASSNFIHVDVGRVRQW